jgi:transposase-like protein
MPRPRRFFPPEYKAEVVELIRTTGKTVGQVAREVARELDLTETAVRQVRCREWDGSMAEPVRARRLTDDEGRRLQQIVRRGKHESIRSDAR